MLRAGELHSEQLELAEKQRLEVMLNAAVTSDGG